MSAEQLHKAMLELCCHCHCLIKDLPTASLPEYVDTHSHQTDYLAPLRTWHHLGWTFAFLTHHCLILQVFVVFLFHRLQQAFLSLSFADGQLWTKPEKNRKSYRMLRPETNDTPSHLVQNHFLHLTVNTDISFGNLSAIELTAFSSFISWIFCCRSWIVPACSCRVSCTTAARF